MVKQRGAILYREGYISFLLHLPSKNSIFSKNPLIYKARVVYNHA